MRGLRRTTKENKQHPKGMGAVIKGWDVKEEHLRNPKVMPAVDFRAMTSACRWDCFHCFTDKLKKDLTLGEIKHVINQLSDMGTWAINFIGEGEPTLDKDFFEIINHTSSKGIRPVVFTDGATKLRDRDFVRKTKESGASIVLKCDSLWNAEYQNWVVGDKKGRYFDQRKEALELLMEEGFNSIEEDGTTRVGFDMVLCRKNADEVERTLRYCRENNLWIIFAFYLPSGRSAKEDFDRSLTLTADEKRRIADTVRRIDEEYGFEHETLNNFLTSASGCVELMCIYGDGRVTPCPGNEDVIGNVRKHKIKELKKKLLEKYPCHDQKTFDGNCCYREKF